MFIIEKLSYNEGQEYIELYQLLKKPLLKIYPNFNEWFLSAYIKTTEERKVYVAKKDGKIIGVCLTKDTIQESKVCTLYVDECHRTNGIGKKLLKIALSDFQNNSRIKTSFNELKNIKMRSFLEKFGFVEKYKLDEEVFLEKALT